MNTMTFPPIYVITGIISIIFILLFFQRAKPVQTRETFTETQIPKRAPTRTPPRKKPVVKLPPVVCLYLVPDNPIHGAALLRFFMTHKLEFNAKKIFQSNREGTIEFSIATLSPPGTFDFDTISEQHFSGLSFFIQTKNTSENLTSHYNKMCSVLLDAQEQFPGVIQNHKQSEVSIQDLKSWRKSLNEEANL